MVIDRSSATRSSATVVACSAHGLSRPGVIGALALHLLLTLAYATDENWKQKSKTSGETVSNGQTHPSTHVTVPTIVIRVDTMGPARI